MYNECQICGEIGKLTILPVRYYVTLCEEHLNTYTEYVLNKEESLELAIARQEKDLKREFELRKWWYYASKNWVAERKLEFREQKATKLEREAGIR